MQYLTTSYTIPQEYKEYNPKNCIVLHDLKYRNGYYKAGKAGKGLGGWERMGKYGKGWKGWERMGNDGKDGKGWVRMGKDG